MAPDPSSQWLRRPVRTGHGGSVRGRWISVLVEARTLDADVAAVAPRPGTAGDEEARAAVRVVGDADDLAQGATVVVDDPAPDQAAQLLSGHAPRLGRQP